MTLCLLSSIHKIDTGSSRCSEAPLDNPVVNVTIILPSCSDKLRILVPFQLSKNMILHSGPEIMFSGPLCYTKGKPQKSADWASSR